MSDDKDDESSPTTNLLAGLGLFAFAGFLYWYFNDMEQSGGRRRMNAILALLYNIGGKWLVVGLVAGIGLIVLVMGLKGLMSKSKT